MAAVVPAGGRTHRVGNLKAGTLYRVAGYASWRGIHETVGRSQDVVTLAVSSSVPAIKIIDSQIVLRWAPVAKATKYRLVQRQVGAPGAALSVDGIAAGGEGKDGEDGVVVGVHNLEPGTAYRFAVFAETPLGYSSESAVVDVVPLGFPPKGLVLADLTADRCVLKWGAVRGATRYCLKARHAGGDFHTLSDAIQETSYALSGLMSGARCELLFSAGTPELLQSNATLVAFTPLPPTTELSVASVTATSMLVQWRSAFPVALEVRRRGE